KVVFVPFTDGKPSGKAQDVRTGFVNDDGQARGRPVGLAIDKSGALLIADDVGNTVWRVLAGPQASASPSACRIRGTKRSRAACSGATHSRHDAPGSWCDIFSIPGACCWPCC